MTIKEFLGALTGTRSKGYQPYLVAQAHRQLIRLKSPAGDEHCPITAVYECYTATRTRRQRSIRPLST